MSNFISGSITGSKQLDRQLNILSNRQIGRIERSAIGKALRIVAKEIKAEAPKQSGATRRSIGTRFKRNAQVGITQAKAGIGVGKKKAKTSDAAGLSQVRRASMARHAHLAALGTDDRYTSTGAYRGRAPSNDFVTRGFARAAGKALAAEREAWAVGIAKAVREL